jgi:catechol-2,3-dioxygenase
MDDQRPIPVQRLNHAVLYVRDVDRSVDFYQRAFGFEVVQRLAGQAAFLRAAGSDNHHDLGLFAVGAGAPSPPAGAVGLYHLAWQVASIHDLAAGRSTLEALGALVGQSDHGATKSLYGRDPDGNEFEVMWMLPRAEWGEYEHSAPVAPLDIEAEVARHG